MQRLDPANWVKNAKHYHLSHCVRETVWGGRTARGQSTRAFGLTLDRCVLIEEEVLTQIPRAFPKMVMRWRHRTTNMCFPTGFNYKKLTGRSYADVRMEAWNNTTISVWIIYCLFNLSSTDNTGPILITHLNTKLWHYRLSLKKAVFLPSSRLVFYDLEIMDDHHLESTYTNCL